MVNIKKINEDQIEITCYDDKNRLIYVIDNKFIKELKEELNKYE